MQEMNNIDYGIIAAIGISVLMGILRGFVREAMSLVTWITAIIVAVLYSEPVSVYFTAISLAPVRLLLAFILLVLLTLIIGGLISHLVSKLMQSTGFSVTDRIMGSLFGFARGAVIVAMVILVGSSSSSVTATPLWKNSFLIPTIQPIADWVKAKFPEEWSKLFPKLPENALKNIPQTQPAE